MLPNIQATCQQVRAKYPSLVNHDQAAAILNEVAWTHRNDGFGMFEKTGGNHCLQPSTGRQCSVDWLVHKPSGLGGDFFADGPGINEHTGERVSGAMHPQQPAGESVNLARFVDPVGPDGVGATHKYRGGEHDTNQCDTCGRDRHDAIHAIPQSKVKHTYDGGEHDTGLCDICQQPNDHPLHVGVDPGPDDVAARIGKVEVQLGSVAAQGAENTRRLEEQGRAIQELQRSSGGQMDMNQFREALKQALSNGLSIQAEVNPNGSGVLRHGHGISIVITYDGQEIARK